MIYIISLYHNKIIIKEVSRLNNPIGELKDKIITKNKNEIQEQKQRKERLHQLEEKQKHKTGLDVINPIKSIKTRIQIKALKKEIQEYNKKRRSKIVVVSCICIAAILTGFICIMAVVENNGEQNDGFDDSFVSNGQNTTSDANENNPTTNLIITHTTIAEQEHIHSFLPATCNEPRTCSCGNTEGIANGHNWENATCLNPKTCGDCGLTEGVKADHDFSNGKCIYCEKQDPNYNLGTMVWIPTNGGTKYHTRPGCSNMENPEEVTQSQAESRGFTPCKRCY